MQRDGMCVRTKPADVLRVYADADGGRGRVDARMRCVCVRTRMSMKKGHKRNTYFGIWVMGVWTRWRADADDCKERKKQQKERKKRKLTLWMRMMKMGWHADAFRADALACGRG